MGGTFVDAVEKYFREVRDILATGEGVDETSFYPCLSALLNSVGSTLTPKVKAILPIRNRGAGIPDGGFFTAEQWRRRTVDEVAAQVPSRGALEAKPIAQNIDQLASSEQVSRYLSRYRQVLLTNFREFLLVTLERDEQRILERISIAADELTFRRQVADPQPFAAREGERLLEYLKRAMNRQAQIASPEDLSWLLASYARDARSRIEGIELPALNSVRMSLEGALGLKFEGEKGEHFFRSTLIQTLFYGIFSAWVLWVRSGKHQAERFNWREAAWYLQVPMMRALFEQVAMPGRLGLLGLVELLDWASDSLNRVDQGAFFSRLGDAEAVQYFYEPFLRSFDPELRKELGVWYTPSEVVRYMVSRVDEALRLYLGIADGLADERVIVLDPACGTGAYLVEVLRTIEKTLRGKRNDALIGDDVRDAAITRLFGFEILPAPFVIAHLQIGLLLQALGSPLSETGRHRAGVFLTNSLTGWEPATDETKRRIEQLTLSFPELREEHDAAEGVKQSTPILVILGNPPYNGFAGVSPEEENGLVDPYKEGLSDWGITKNYLDDLYVRFYRVAERKIGEMSSRGIVAFISNFSFLRQPSFVMMRKRLVSEFDRITIDNMNGDSRITGKKTPTGEPDPSVFSTEYNREGIQVGTAISVLVKGGRNTAAPSVRYRDFWGSAKRSNLLLSLQRADEFAYVELDPRFENQYSLVPRTSSVAFRQWPEVTALAKLDPMLGLNENRKFGLIEIEREILRKRMESYYDPAVPDELVASMHSGLMTNAASYDAKKTRARETASSKFDKQNIVQMTFRPFDFRWAYVERIGNLWNRVRPELLDQAWPGNQFFYVRRDAPRAEDGAPAFYSRTIADQHALHKDAYLIPFRLRTAARNEHTSQNRLFEDHKPETEDANLSAAARRYLVEIGCSPADDGDAIWYHALAITYSPQYVSDAAGEVRLGWPRLPLPGTADQLRASAVMGRRVAELLESDEAPEDGNRGFGVVISLRPDGKLVLPDDLFLRAGWGYLGKRSATMPGAGKTIERSFSTEDEESITAAAAAASLSVAEAIGLLGSTTFDVFLNGEALWKNVPRTAWQYTIGGYQVLKKWLSYREEEIIRRPLTKGEVRAFGYLVTRLVRLLLLTPALDANYRQCVADSFDWSRS